LQKNINSIKEKYVGKWINILRCLLKQPPEILLCLLVVVPTDFYFRHKASANTGTFRMIENGTFQIFGKVNAPGQRRFATRHPRNGGTYRWINTACTTTRATFHVSDILKLILTEAN